MLVGLHDAEGGTKYPNLALMKLSAWHKAQGDEVEWFLPLKAQDYDKVYSSKVFTWTKPDPFLPAHTVKGGTGYGMTLALPEEVEHICPDYSLYKGIDRSYGFLTRGCILHCPWCVVPGKEGKIHANADVEEFLRHKKVVCMDNNVLAHPWGIQQIEKMAKLRVAVDFNQGLDARLIDPAVAKRLASLRWIKNIRLACDSQGQMPSVERAVRLLKEAGSRTPVFCYCLIREPEEALQRLNFLRRLGVIPFAQPFRDFTGRNDVPTPEQKDLARWANLHRFFKAMTWPEFQKHLGGRSGRMEANIG